MSKNRLSRINNNALAIIIIVIFWALFSLFTGTVNSGYHFTDDHEIITINNNLDNDGLIITTENVLKKDLKIRFRPFYYIHRVLLTNIFESNFLLWSIHNYVLAILTSFLLFLFIYIQGYKFVYAILFPFLVLIGTQTAIWWRLGPTETIGIFMLSASLVFLVNYVFGRKKYQLFISIFLLVIASLSKESFTLFIPAYILMYIKFKMEADTGNSFMNVLRNNILPLAMVSLVFIIEIYIILFEVGANEIGYAGVDSFSFSRFTNFAKVHIKHNLHLYLLIILELLIIIPHFKFSRINPKTVSKKQLSYIFVTVILLSIILPQYVLHFKSGLYERYLIPLNIGLSYFIIFWVSEIMESEKKLLFAKKIFLFLFVSIGVSIPIFYATYKAKEFTEEGVSTNLFLSTINSVTHKNDSILIVLDGYENFEWGHSINQYLKINEGIETINFLLSNSKLDEEYGKNLQKEFTVRFKDNIVRDIENNFACIAVLPNSGNSEVKEKLDNNTFYERMDFNSFTLYTKINN